MASASRATTSISLPEARAGPLQDMTETMRYGDDRGPKRRRSRVLQRSLELHARFVAGVVMLSEHGMNEPALRLGESGESASVSQAAEQYCRRRKLVEKWECVSEQRLCHLVCYSVNGLVGSDPPPPIGSFRKQEADALQHWKECRRWVRRQRFPVQPSYRNGAVTTTLIVSSPSSRVLHLLA
jgi:hypothetical protein